jgi:DNA-binding transcriptional MerR regulator
LRHCKSHGQALPVACAQAEIQPFGATQGGINMASQFSISDLAKEFDLTTRAIRFYEDMGLLEPERSGPGGRNRVYSSRDRTRLKLTLRAKRLGLSLVEAKELIDMYDTPRDTGPQLKKFMVVLAEHRQQLESQLADLHATLEEVKTHEKEARNLLARSEKIAVKKVSA